ncbi:hypothetical protein FSHL1_003783 [Fusarium sambucinum]
MLSIAGFVDGNRALASIMTEGIKARDPEKIPTIRNWHDFNRSVSTGWTPRLDAPNHPVLRKRWLLETHTTVGKLIRYTPSETNGLARRAGAHVFLAITLNYE